MDILLKVTFILGLPLLVTIANWFILNKEGTVFEKLVLTLFFTLQHYFGYFFLLYFLESEKFVNGWYSLPFSVYFLPFGILVVILRVFLLFKKRYIKTSEK